MNIGNRTYDVLKFLALYVLPALASFYAGVSIFWRWPYVKEIISTIMAFDTFLGVFLDLSFIRYKANQEPMESNPKIELIKFGISPALYDSLLWVAQVFIPGFTTLYYTIALLWGIPYTDSIVGTLAGLDTLLGVILGISNANFKKALK